MSETLGQRKWKMETQLPHLWNPHKIKKIRQDETEIQNSNLDGACTRRLSPLWRKRLALAGRDMCSKTPHSATPYHRSLHSGLCPHYRGNTLVTHFLKQTDIWKEEAKLSHSNADTTRWTTSSSIWYRFTSTEISPLLGNYSRNSNERTERNFSPISFQRSNPLISKKSF